MCRHTYGACSLFQLFFPFLPLLTCLALPLYHVSEHPSSPTAPARPLPAFHCTSTSPYLSIWCSQLFKKNYQLACMKSKREKEIKGNCGNRALQKSSTSQVFPAGPLLASLGHLPRTRGFGGGGGEGMRAQLSAGVEGEHTQQHHLLLLLLGTGEHTSTQATGFGSRTVGGGEGSIEISFFIHLLNTYLLTT